MFNPPFDKKKNIMPTTSDYYKLYFSKLKNERTGNPYSDALSSANYTSNIFDEMFDTQTKKLESAALDYQAKLNSWQYQFDKTNAYNSPAAQVDRMRHAGLNPDLQGVENFSSASPSGFDAGLASMQTETGVGVMSSVVGAFQTAVSILGGGISGIMSAISAGYDIAGKKIDNASKEMHASDKLVNTAISYIVSNLGRTVYDSYQRDLSNISKGKGLTGDVIVLPSNFFDPLGLSNDVNTKLVDIGNKLINKRSPLLLKALYKEFGDVEKFTQDYNTLMGNVKVTDDNGNRRPDYDEQRISREISEVILDIWELKSIFDRKYYKNLDGVTRALSENAKYKHEYDYYGSRDGVFEALGQNLSDQYTASYYNELLKDNTAIKAADVEYSRLEELRIATEFNNSVNNVFKKHFTKLSKDLGTESNFYTALLISLLAQAFCHF